MVDLSSPAYFMILFTYNPKVGSITSFSQNRTSRQVVEQTPQVGIFPEFRNQIFPCLTHYGLLQKRDVLSTWARYVPFQLWCTRYYCSNFRIPILFRPNGFANSRPSSTFSQEGGSVYFISPKGNFTIMRLIWRDHTLVDIFFFYYVSLFFARSCAHNHKKYLKHSNTCTHGGFRLTAHVCLSLFRDVLSTAYTTFGGFLHYCYGFLQTAALGSDISGHRRTKVRKSSRFQRYQLVNKPIPTKPA